MTDHIENAVRQSKRKYFDSTRAPYKPFYIIFDLFKIHFFQIYVFVMLAPEVGLTITQFEENCRTQKRIDLRSSCMNKLM